MKIKERIIRKYLKSEILVPTAFQSEIPCKTTSPVGADGYVHKSFKPENIKNIYQKIL